MTGERGLHAAIGIVLAFSILWTFAILLPDGDSSAASTKPFDGLIVNGNHYVLDTNVDQTSSGQVYKVIHAVTVKTPAKVTTSKNIKRVSTKLIRVSNIEFDEDSNSSVAAKCCQ
jgi:hypothetical protein